jgi:hypothetical protein
LARLVAGSGGYAATVGGTVRIFGTTDVEVISLADTAGTVSFDSSFNRGGDFIILPNAANTYSISRVGSSVTLSDADSTITIPVGSKGSTLQFADGELILKFSGQVLLGSQVISAASATITATLSAKTTLPAATSATGTLITSANEPVLIGGNVRIFGTNGPDTVTIADVPGNLRFDGSFNRGGDTIVLNKLAESYSAARPDPSNIMIGDGDTNLAIPLGIKGLNVAFANEERMLVYANKNAYLGNQKLESTALSAMKFEENIKYIKVENAFSGDAPLNGDGGSNRPVIFDINNDGYLDILFWWMTNAPILGENYRGKPAIAKLQLLINNKNSGFVDETLKYFHSSDVDGTTDSFVVHDFNGDGVLDVVFATNREDGRNSDDPNDLNNKLNGLMSNLSTGKHDNIQFGKESCYFYINSFDINGIKYISAYGTFGDSPIQEVFSYKEGSFVLESGLFPINSASDPWQPFSLGLNYIFYDVDGDGSADTMYNPNARGPLYVNGIQTEEFTSGIDAYNFDSKTKQWSHLGSYFPMNEKEFVKNVKFIGWNLNEGVQPIFEYGPSTYSVRNDVYITSAMIKLNPNDKPVYASLVGSTILYSADVQKIESINEWDLTPRVYVAFFDIVDGQLTKVNYKVSGIENMDLFGANYMFSLDYNRDSFEDIVISTWNKENSPIILLNNKDYSFYKFENIAENKNYISGSFFADFNNDGLVDIFSYISDGSFDIKTADMSQFSLYIASNSVVGG